MHRPSPFRHSSGYRECLSIGAFVTVFNFVAAAGCNKPVDPPLSNVSSGSRAEAVPAEPKSIDVGNANLLEARAGFETKLVPSDYQPGGPAPDPPPEIFQSVKYRSSAGELAAYLTPDPGDGQKNPAVIWAHGGFGGIGNWFWEPAPWMNDQSARAFREAGIVMMCPSWRGECDNPGQFEMFLGEVNDLLAAREFLANLPYVDPERIYVAGHSTGGTLTLLAVTATDKFRAAFSFGGAPDVGRVVSDGRGYGNTPFDFRSYAERFYRSPINFVHAINTQTFYFEGQSSTYCDVAREMEERARQKRVPFTACIIEGGDHFNILTPLTRFVAAHIQRDAGARCEIEITPEMANDFFQLELAQYREQRAKLLAELPLVEFTPLALEKLLDAARTESVDLEKRCVRVGITDGRWDLKFDEFKPDEDLQLTQGPGPLTIVVAKSSADQVRGCRVDYVEKDGQAGFAFEAR